MLLDSFRLHTVIVQLLYPERYEIWDNAGAIARQIDAIWPQLKIDDQAKPNQQIMLGPNVQISTTLTHATVTLIKGRGFDAATVDQLRRTFSVWREELGLTMITRLSCRSKYVKTFPTRREANAYLLSWGLCPMPTGRVFDQPQDGDGNSVEMAFRFEDADSFAFVRVGSESLTVEVAYHPELDDAEGNQTGTHQKHRVYVDFDRGVLGNVDARQIQLAEWLKGYTHLLRRDLEKVIRPGDHS